MTLPFVFYDFESWIKNIQRFRSELQAPTVSFANKIHNKNRTMATFTEESIKMEWLEMATTKPLRQSRCVSGHRFINFPTIKIVLLKFQQQSEKKQRFKRMRCATR